MSAIVHARHRAIPANGQGCGRGIPRPASNRSRSRGGGLPLTEGPRRQRRLQACATATTKCLRSTRTLQPWRVTEHFPTWRRFRARSMVSSSVRHRRGLSQQCVNASTSASAECGSTADLDAAASNRLPPRSRRCRDDAINGGCPCMFGPTADGRRRTQDHGSHAQTHLAMCPGASDPTRSAPVGGAHSRARRGDRIA